MANRLGKIKWTNSVIWTNKQPAIDFNTMFIRKVQDFVEAQIKDFLKENNISEKAWIKRGIISQLPPDISGISYVLYYKHFRKKVERKIRMEYSIVGL